MITAITGTIAVLGLFGWTFSYFLVTVCEKREKEYEQTFYDGMNSTSEKIKEIKNVRNRRP